MLAGQNSPLSTLLHRLQILGRLLALLCVGWVGAVGFELAVELSPDDLQNHRSPVVQEKVAACDGAFSQRYACTQTILLDGERISAGTMAVRILVTLVLPGIAWSVWTAVIRRTERLAWQAQHLIR